MQMNQTVEKKETNNKVGCKIATTTVKQSQKFMCRARDFYNVMTSPEVNFKFIEISSNFLMYLTKISQLFKMAMAFTHGPVKLEPEKGGKFEFFSGNIYGEFVELSPKKIVQKWRCKQWPDGQISLVTMEIDEKSDVTEVNITQTGVPSKYVVISSNRTNIVIQIAYRHFLLFTAKSPQPRKIGTNITGTQ